MIDKPFKTIEEQIEIMRDRQLIINNTDFAKEALESISYYSLLNGYKSLFKESESSENFKIGTTFEMIYLTHWIDSSLSNILFKYILIVEKSLKTKISYFVAENIGVNHSEYLDIQNFSNRKRKQKSIYEKLIYSYENCKDTSPTYYYKENKNHVPPWIFVRDISFGLAQQWFSILPTEGKREVQSKMVINLSSQYSDDSCLEFLVNSLEILRDFRNRAAHGNRTFNFKSHKEISNGFYNKLNKPNEIIVSKEEYRRGFGRNDLFAVLVILETLINDDFARASLTAEVKDLFSLYDHMNFFNKNVYQVFNLPENFDKRLGFIKSN